MPDEKRHDLKNWWSDEQKLEVLHMLDHQGLTTAQVAAKTGSSRRAIADMRRDIMTASRKYWPDTTGDGTMPPLWWRR